MLSKRHGRASNGRKVAAKCTGAQRSWRQAPSGGLRRGERSGGGARRPPTHHKEGASQEGNAPGSLAACPGSNCSCYALTRLACSPLLFHSSFWTRLSCTRPLVTFPSCLQRRGGQALVSPSPLSPHASCSPLFPFFPLSFFAAGGSFDFNYRRSPNNKRETKKKRGKVRENPVQPCRRQGGDAEHLPEPKSTQY